jgi:hypothetical protein
MEAALYPGVSAQTIQLLLDAGADVNLACVERCVALHDDVNVDVIRVLLTAGAWVDAATISADTPLYQACKIVREGVLYQHISRDAHKRAVALLLAGGAAFQ